MGLTNKSGLFAVGGWAAQAAAAQNLTCRCPTTTGAEQYRALLAVEGAATASFLSSVPGIYVLYCTILSINQSVCL